MRSRLPVFLLFTSVAAGCTTTTTNNTAVIVPVVQRTVSSTISVRFQAVADRRSRLYSAFNLNPDCSVAGYSTLRLTTPPQHGNGTIEQGLFYPNYPAANQRYACNLKPQGGVALFYQPSAGYIGDDDLVVDSISPFGQGRIFDYHITVK